MSRFITRENVAHPNNLKQNIDAAQRDLLSKKRAVAHSVAIVVLHERNDEVARQAEDDGQHDSR